MDEANARTGQVFPLEARNRELELAWANGERDAQQAAAYQKAQEAEAQAAELQRSAVVLEQKDKALKAKEAEL